ncbi:MAG: hypothetical protein LBF85_00570 [Tannerella sp.]|nr:hypothetical protein [Tannerella sp.]
MQTVALRKSGKAADANRLIALIERDEPLNHYARFEKYLFTGAMNDRKEFLKYIRYELPHETFM